MDLLRLSALGGVLGLDGTSVGQFMTGRPLVAGLLAGWVAGEPALGAVIGVILEVYLLVSFPTGGARFPEGATATVVAVASAAPFMDTGVESGAMLTIPATGAGEGGMAAVPLAVAVGLLWGQLGGLSISALRKVNGRLAPDAGDDAHVRRRVERTHLVSIGLDALRGFLVTLSGIAAGRVVLGATVRSWPLGDAGSTGLLLAGGAVSAGILLHDIGGFRSRRVWFVAGLAVGLLGVRIL